MTSSPPTTALDALQDLYSADRQPGDDTAAKSYETALKRQHAQALKDKDEQEIHRLSGQVKAAGWYRARIVEQLTPSRKVKA